MSSRGSSGLGWFCDVLDDVLSVNYVDRHLTSNGFANYLARFESDILTWPEDRRRLVFYEVPTPSEFGAEFRRRLAGLLTLHEQKLKRITAGFSLSTPSSIIRGTLTATFWLAPPGYPTMVSQTPQKSLEWLAGQLPTPGSSSWPSRYEALRADYVQSLRPTA